MFVLNVVVADVADVLERCLVSSVVHEDVDAAQLVDRFLNDGSAMIGVLQIARYQDGLTAFFLDQIPDLFGVVIFGQVSDQDIGTLSRVRDRRPMPL